MSIIDDDPKPLLLKKIDENQNKYHKLYIYLKQDIHILTQQQIDNACKLLEQLKREVEILKQQLKKHQQLNNISINFHFSQLSTYQSSHTNKTILLKFLQFYQFNTQKIHLNQYFPRGQHIIKDLQRIDSLINILLDGFQEKQKALKLYRFLKQSQEYHIKISLLLPISHKQLTSRQQQKQNKNKQDYKSKQISDYPITCHTQNYSNNSIIINNQSLLQIKSQEKLHFKEKNQSKYLSFETQKQQNLEKQTFQKLSKLEEQTYIKVIRKYKELKEQIKQIIIKTFEDSFKQNQAIIMFQFQILYKKTSFSSQSQSSNIMKIVDKNQCHEYTLSLSEYSKEKGIQYNIQNNMSKQEYNLQNLVQLQDKQQDAASIRTNNCKQIISSGLSRLSQEQQEQVYKFINMIRQKPQKLKQLIDLQKTTFIWQKQTKSYRCYWQCQIQMHIRQLQAFHDDKLKILRQICQNDGQIYCIYKRQTSKYIFNIQQCQDTYNYFIKFDQQQKYTLCFKGNSWYAPYNIKQHKQEQNFAQLIPRTILVKIIQTKWENVYILNLSYTNIGSLQFKLLANRLCLNFPILQILDVSDNMIQQINLNQLNELNNHKNIKQIIVFNNKIKINKINLSDILEMRIFSLLKYDIQSKDVQYQLVDGSKSNLKAQSIVKKLWNSKIQLNIKSLNLSQNQLNDQDFEIIIQNLHLFGHLKQLDLSRNKINNLSQQIVIILQQYCCKHHKNTNNSNQQILVINLQNNHINKSSLDLLRQFSKTKIKIILPSKLDNQKQQYDSLSQLLNMNGTEKIKQKSYYYNLSRQLLWSSILNQQHLQILKNWFQKPIKTIRLKFKASKFDFKLKKYFQICGDLTHTIIIAKTTKGKIIGGYTPLSFNPLDYQWKYSYNNQSIKDQSNSSFLFSLSEKYKFQLIQKDTYAITRWKYKSSIEFYNTFIIYDEANTNPQGNQFILGNNYYNTSKYPDSKQNYQKIIGQQNYRFLTQQWQVYQVFFA